MDRAYRGAIAGIVLLACTGCGSHAASMHGAVLRYLCGGTCKHGRDARLESVRRDGNYATAFVRSVPEGWFQDGNVLLHRLNGRWRVVSAWSDLAGRTCKEIAREMRTPERVLIALRICN
jgi:hypothetical protein